MDDQSHDDPIPIAPIEPAAQKTCPVCFAKMVPDSPVCHRCRYDERIGPESSDLHDRITNDNRYAETPYATRQCRDCGYDLSGLPRHTTCPECGKGPKPARQIATKQAPARPIKRLCLNCHYDVTSLPLITTCPECGNPVGTTAARHAARQAEQEERQQSRSAYVMAGALFGVGMIGMIVIYAATQNVELIPLYLARFAIRAPLVIAVFILCSILWIGFDEPLKITAIRLAALLPLIDLIGTLSYGMLSSMIPPVLLNLLFVRRWIQVVALFLLLNKVVEVDVEDAALLSMAIIVVYTISSIYLNLLMLPPGGLPWPGLF